MGSGGVGGYLGAKLAAAGNDVTFIARGNHLAAMLKDGLRILGAEIFDTPVVKATDIPAKIGPVELVLLSVKLRDTDAAAEAILPIAGPDTMVLTLQNGIDSIQQDLGRGWRSTCAWWGRVLPGIDLGAWRDHIPWPD